MKLTEELETLTDGSEIDLEMSHHFSDGLYAKEMHIKKGYRIISHKHKYSHLSLLAQGVAIVRTDDTQEVYTAPACIEIKAGVHHEITALEDVTWFCIHATTETDENKVDEVLIGE